MNKIACFVLGKGLECEAGRFLIIGPPLEGLVLRLKLQNFGHLMQRANPFEETLMLGKTEGKKRRG